MDSEHDYSSSEYQVGQKILAVYCRHDIFGYTAPMPESFLINSNHLPISDYLPDIFTGIESVYHEQLTVIGRFVPYLSNGTGFILQNRLGVEYKSQTDHKPSLRILANNHFFKTDHNDQAVPRVLVDIQLYWQYLVYQVAKLQKEQFGAEDYFSARETIRKISSIQASLLPILIQYGYSVQLLPPTA